MPYSIEPKGDLFCVYDNDTGKKMGEHPSRTEAMKQMKALYAKEAKGGVKKESDKKKKSDDDEEEDNDY